MKRILGRSELDLPHGPVLVISPHLDDAVLSIGGLLWGLVQDGHEVTVVTTMAGVEGMSETSAGAAVNRSGGLDSSHLDPFRARRLEDVAALNVLGLAYVHLDRETALNRTRADGSPFYPSAHHIQQGPAKDDQTLFKVIDDLREVDRTIAHSSVLGPVGHGGHPDHEIVHDAVMTVFGRQTLYLWYDRPYSAGYRLRNPLAMRIPMSPAATAAKVESTQCYESQTVQLFVTESPTTEIVGGGFETLIDGRPWAVEIESVVRRLENLARSTRNRLRR